MTEAIAIAWSAIVGFPTWAGVVLWPVGRLVLMVVFGIAAVTLFASLMIQAAEKQARKQSAYQPKRGPWSL